MRKLTLLSTLALFLFLLGCAKEEIKVETLPAGALEAMKIAEARVAEVEKLIQQEEQELEFRGNTVELTPSSGYGFADAVGMAGPNGKVTVAAGEYHEPGTVMITERVTIEAEEGAVLYVDVAAPGFQHDPAIYVRNASHVRISGLELRPESGPGNTGILVENGPQTRLQNNRVIGFGFAVWLYDANNARVLENYLDGTSVGIWGLVVQKGRHVALRGNEVTNYSLGIFMSDRGGTTYNNETYGNGGAGIFFCTAQFNLLPDGTPLTAPEAANNWVVTGNYSHNNIEAGYQLMDGAFENLVVQNESANNGTYDIELRGDFTNGIFFPTSFSNQVISVGQYRNYLIKDCGEDNSISGGVLVDTTVDPCLE